MVSRGLGFVVAGLLASTPARADRCPTLEDWTVIQGELLHGRGCGSWVGTTSGATVAYSLGQFAPKQTVTLPYRVTVTWQRLGADARSLELHLLGAVVLLGPDRVALWIDDQRFKTDGYHPFPGHSTRDLHTVSVVQHHDRIEVEVDGRAVDRWAFRSAISSGNISIAFKGGRGARARMWFRELRIDALR